VNFLKAGQSDDGAWRSSLYGNFKTGDALTPLAHLAMCEANHEHHDVLHRGADYLAGLTRQRGLIYPVYTASLAVMALAHPRCPLREEARQTWLTFVRQRQLTESLGWRHDDREYGGWGYSQAIPVKPEPSDDGPPLVESNLSATAFALDALHEARIQPDDGLFRKALVFVERCQNFGEHPLFDDGGFYFMYDDAIRNKAGVIGLDDSGRERYASYGSMTADGLRSLRLCGVARDHPRVTAACQWLDRHFSFTNPGRWSRDRHHIQLSIHFYWLWVLAKALRSVDGLSTRWAETLTSELLAGQRTDGSWLNPNVEVREDDPIVATSLAVLTLVECRRALSPEPEPP
jgi:squalene-hopene/tetraprenyl-beta-curcumene cyclase